MQKTAPKPAMTVQTRIHLVTGALVSRNVLIINGKVVSNGSSRR